MGLIRFYGLVLREAFRHSLDIAQAVIFVALAAGGFIAARNPASKPMIDALDMGGWKMAAIVSGSIIVIRLLLAPYWLFRGASTQLADKPERSIAYKLRLWSFNYRFTKGRRAIQVVFHLNNGSYFHAIKYEVEDIHVNIGDDTNENPKFINRGGVISANSTLEFDFDWIQISASRGLKLGTKGSAGVTFKYGIAGQPFARRGRYAAEIVFQKPPNVTMHMVEESDDPI
jgi:hypothetical protein